MSSAGLPVVYISLEILQFDLASYVLKKNYTDKYFHIILI